MSLPILLCSCGLQSALLVEVPLIVEFMDVLVGTSPPVVLALAWIVLMTELLGTILANPEKILNGSLITGGAQEEEKKLPLESINSN